MWQQQYDDDADALVYVLHHKRVLQGVAFVPPVEGVEPGGSWLLWYITLSPLPWLICPFLSGALLWDLLQLTITSHFILNGRRAMCCCTCSK